ncbi:MAG TPA: hypothetical protein DCM40_29355, partial [Maribacter sp.]|nr:hypothetical protein [Maribacter sp.]|tara:strand:- start:235 stop:498 length:264 start_codon:yes stop_codon:yes gene_type:complete
MSMTRLSGAEFKYSENGASATKDDYIKELERFYELFVDYRNFTGKDIRDKEMKILLLKWEVRKLKNKLNNEKLKVDNGLDVSKLSDS